MSGADFELPGQFRPDLIISPHSSLELTSRQYLDGLKVWDAYRVSLFVHLIRRSMEGVSWKYAVMAYGSTTRVRDRDSANDIDLKVLSDSEVKEDRLVATMHIVEAIRGHYERLRVPFREYDRTFKWDSVHPYETFADQISNEDPSFVVHSLPDAPGLPLHISIAGHSHLPAHEKIEIARRGSGNRSFSLLLEPDPQSS